MGSHLNSVREALAGAVDAAPGAELDDNGGGGTGAVGKRKFLPEDCPVKAVGTEGGVYYFLSALGELRALKADQVANKHIVGLFAPASDYLLEQWPRKKEVKTIDQDTGEEKTEWIVTGWRTDDVSMLLMDSAASLGVWNAREKVRGRGGWQADDGSLVLHAGDRVLLGGSWRRPGLYEGLVYPTQPASPRPAKAIPDRAGALAPKLVEYLEKRGAEADEHSSAGELLLELFKCWRFARPMVDPMLLLGWNAGAIYGGALDYRPLAWLTGDKATGKSALQKAIGLLHGNGILQSPDATEAAVRQILGQQSLPVAIDEAEADEDNRKMLALVKLARLAATSQGNILKGGQDHQGHEFRATSCFLFSSILIPPIPPQDKSRLAVLEMEEIEAGAREPPLDKRELAELGAIVRRTMAERWPMWPARLAAFRNAMIDVGGHQGRVADQFGSLLAAAHLLQFEEAPSAGYLEAWGHKLSLGQLTEVNDNTAESDRCIGYMVTKQVQLGRGGERRQVSEWLLDCIKRPDTGRGFVDDTDSAEIRRKAREAIGRLGLRIVEATSKGVPGVVYVAVASEHQGLAELFQGSRWGASVWAQALRRAKGAVGYDRQRINGRIMACTLVPLMEMVSEDLEDVRERERESV